MLNRIIHYYWRLKRGMTLGVRGVVLDGEGRVLLVRHGYAPGWHLPGGGVEPGETFAEALARELLEEGNVRLTGAAVLHGIFQHPAASERDHVAVYVVREFEWAGARKPTFEIPEARFFSISDLPGNLNEGSRRRLEEILRKLPPAARW
jgi:ADP-ribose pyrophosphatase YjhB (NUDIX family)